MPWYSSPWTAIGNRSMNGPACTWVLAGLRQKNISYLNISSSIPQQNPARATFSRSTLIQLSIDTFPIIVIVLTLVSQFLYWTILINRELFQLPTCALLKKFWSDIEIHVSFISLIWNFQLKHPVFLIPKYGALFINRSQFNLYFEHDRGDTKVGT